MGFKDFLKDYLTDIDEPLPEISANWGLFKKGKIQVTIIYEDKSSFDFYVKLGKSYKMTIKNRDYIIVPECILYNKKGRQLFYFFNNPFPINFEYQKSTLTSSELYDKKDFEMLDEDLQHTLVNTFIDAESLHAAFSNNIITKMYLQGNWSAKNIIIIAVVAVIVLLIVLHMFGVIDLYALVSGQALQK